ncbi:restriction endonuclease subunit R, partial [Patescibacteria group bacterium]|nr:restriction endonuclease subunit R [Patescibacteria group bacterium]
YLINPIVTDARTKITTQLLSDKGYAMMVENEDGVLEEQIFYQKDFERKFFSKKTNRQFCQTFLKHALEDPITGEIGKTIIFCVSQNHARKITQLLNEYAHKLFPDKYNSDFAVQVTSVISEAQGMSLSFANNNLNGHTKWLDCYDSAKARVCVTVGMMTTGYDCEDILNLCLMRPVFSPTNFIQMKGRGTRLYSFKYEVKEDGERQEVAKQKKNFKLFDFFANCEYFEEKFNYDEVLKLPQPKTGDGPGGNGSIDIDEIVTAIPDPLKTLTQTPIGLKGMKVDRKLFESFEEKVKKNDFIRQNYQEGNIDTAENYIKEEIFDKPEDYINLEKLRQSVRLDRRLTVREVMDKVFGCLDRFKTKDELCEEEYSKFVSIHKPDNEHIVNLKNYFKAYVTDPAIRQIIDDGDFTRLATNPKLSMEELTQLGRSWITTVPEYIKDYVSINRFL